MNGQLMRCRWLAYRRHHRRSSSLQRHRKKPHSHRHAAILMTIASAVRAGSWRRGDALVKFASCGVACASAREEK